MHENLQVKCRRPKTREHTGDHTLCEPAQSKYTSTFHKSPLFARIYRKKAGAQDRDPTLCARKRSRNARGHFTRATLCEILEVKMPRTSWSTLSKHRPLQYTYPKKTLSVNSTACGEKNKKEAGSRRGPGGEPNAQGHLVARRDIYSAKTPFRAHLEHHLISSLVCSSESRYPPDSHYVRNRHFSHCPPAGFRNNCKALCVIFGSRIVYGFPYFFISFSDHFPCDFAAFWSWKVLFHRYLQHF